MKELNLSVTTSGSEDKGNTVVLTARFATHDEAVAFHDGLARLCRGATQSSGMLFKHNTIYRLLGKDAS